MNRARAGSGTFVRLSTCILLSASLLCACAGHQELGMVAASLKDSTQPMSERASALKTRHIGLTDAYNQLRLEALAAGEQLQQRLCEQLAESSRVSLYRGHAAAHKWLLEQLNEAINAIPDTLDAGLTVLNAEIDRQRNLAEQQGHVGSAQPLPGRYSDMVRMALLSARRDLRLRGTVRGINGIQTVVVSDVVDLEAYMREQETSIARVETECKTGINMRDALAERLGGNADMSDLQYDVLTQYFEQVAVAAGTLELYVQTNRLFGGKGLIVQLIAGLTQSLTTLRHSETASNSTGTLSNDDLRDAFVSAASAYFNQASSKFENFSLAMILQEAGLDSLTNRLDDTHRDLQEQVEGEAEEATEQAKSSVDSEISGTSNNGG